MQNNIKKIVRHRINSSFIWLWRNAIYARTLSLWLKGQKCESHCRWWRHCICHRLKFGNLHYKNVVTTQFNQNQIRQMARLIPICYIYSINWFKFNPFTVQIQTINGSDLFGFWLNCFFFFFNSFLIKLSSQEMADSGLTLYSLTSSFSCVHSYWDWLIKLRTINWIPWKEIIKENNNNEALNDE